MPFLTGQPAFDLASTIVSLVRGRKKKKDSPAPTLGQAEQPVFTSPTVPQQAVLPPVAGPTPGQDSSAWLAMALSSIGGGPDRGLYTQPFDQAAARAQGAHDQSLPAIAAGYDQLRGKLGQDQAVTDQAAGQAQANMAAQQGQSQASIAAMVAPVLAQLQAAGGTAALGSLTGALQAQVGTGQAQLAQQGQAQTQLSQNLQAAGTQGAASRVADSQLAQQGAVTSANSNLEQVLGALSARKADSLKQYASDSQSHAGSVAQAKMQAMDREAAAPAKAIELQRAQLQLQNDQLDLANRQGTGPMAGPNKFTPQVTDWHSKISESNPTSYKFLSELMGDGATPLPALIGKINSQAKNGKVSYGGKQLDARWLRDRLTELDQLEQQQADEEARRTKARG